MEYAPTPATLPSDWPLEVANACFAALITDPDLAFAVHLPGQPDRWYANAACHRLMGPSPAAPSPDWRPDEKALALFRALNAPVPGHTAPATLYVLPAGQHHPALRKLQHDARTPLTAIQVYTECLLEDLELSEEQEQDLRRILMEVRRLTTVLATAEPSAL